MKQELSFAALLERFFTQRLMANRVGARPTLRHQPLGKEPL